MRKIAKLIIDPAPESCFAFELPALAMFASKYPCNNDEHYSTYKNKRHPDCPFEISEVE